jgi:hypothetical protein
MAFFFLAAGRMARAQWPEPDAFVRGVLANPHLRTTGTGEGFAWHAASQAEVYLDAYEVSKDARWLEAAEQHYEMYLSKLQKDPDGYEGWIGDPISEEGAELSTDALVGDAILLAPLVRFAALVKADPALSPRFGAVADRYIALATRIGWEKWNRRGCYYQDAAGWGSYHTYGRLIDLKNNRWVDAPSRVISDNLNKHYRMGIVLLRLWQVTGRPEYKDRVMRLFGRAKTMWRYFPDEDRIVWNFWMPHGPYDIEGRAPKSWVGVHPDRPGYQAGEVAMFVEVYDAGLVFDADDLRRMIRTNLWMYNDGNWRSADGTSKAGTLWSALARFDDRLRDLHLNELRAGRGAAMIHRDYFEKVLAPLGFRRRYQPDESRAEVVRVPLQPGRFLSMTVAIPDCIEIVNDTRMKLASQTRTAGTLRVELLDETGQRSLGVLAETAVGDKSEYQAPIWDGTLPGTPRKEKGKYLVRWTLAAESRTQPVWVVEGEPRAGAARPSALARGQTIAEDFEGTPDPRWEMDRAEVSSEQAHGGRRSLKVNGQAQLVFGNANDLPVRVTLWVWDAGGRFQSNANGPAWGIGTAQGDKFAVRIIWRRYMDGNKIYAWFNTGENQWFNPHNTRIPRKDGWSRWVFDFTKPDAVQVTADDRAASLDAQWTPKGAVSVFLLGSREGGPLYVDDITVEYP